MDWPQLGQWEWAVGEAIVLPLLFFELYRLRRSQRRDREAQRKSSSAGAADGPGHAERQQGLDP
jgi:hypothetical protein